MSPAACPKCHQYEWLTKPDPANSFLDKLYKISDIVCENCGWVGEADELDEVDSDG